MARRKQGSSRADHATRWKPGQSGNPAGRRSRADGWQNALTALGTSFDKRTAGDIRLDVVSALHAQLLWRANDVCKRAIELIPEEAFRRGFRVRMEDAELAEAVESRLEELPGPHYLGRGASAALTRAIEYEDAYGGAAIWPVVNDASGDLASPLDWQRIRSIERLQVLEARELYPLRRYTDPMHPKWGEPETYQLRPLSGNQAAVYLEIHETRLIIFPGFRVTRQQLATSSAGWGDSIFNFLLSPINDFELVYGSAAALIQDFAQAVVKLKDLGSVVGVNPQAAQAKLSFMNQARSTLRAMLLDSEDDFTRISTPLAGLDAIMDRIAGRLAAAREIPVSILMGRTPTGLSSTGDEDTRAFYGTVDKRRARVLPQVEQLVEFVLAEQTGPAEGAAPDVWSVEFPPLWTPTEKESAETRLAIAQADQIWYNVGSLSSDDIAGHWPEGGDGFNPEVRVDWDSRRAQQEVEEEQQRAAAAAAINQSPPGVETSPGAPDGEPDGSESNEAEQE